MKQQIKKLIPPKYMMLAGVKYHNFKSLFRKSIPVEKDNKVVIVVASPPKVGSTWIYHVLRELTAFHDIFPPLRTFHDLRKARIPLEDLIPYFNGLRNGKGYLFKSHSRPPVSSSKYVKTIAVVRDPRDVFVSLASYLTNIPEEVGGWGEELSQKSTKEKLIEIISKNDYVYDLYLTWSKCEDCLLLTYEGMKQDINGCVKQVLDYCGLETSEENIQNAINKYDFSRVSGRKEGQENKKSFYRKGIVGDWKNNFDEEVLDCLYTSNNARWKDLILDLGYEL